MDSASVFFFAKTTHDFLQIYTRKKTQNFPTRLELTEKMQMERFKKPKQNNEALWKREFKGKSRE